MSDCKVFRAEIEEAADGGALSVGAGAHVASCAACGEALRGREALRGLVRGLGRVEAPPDFEYRLRARMARSKPGGGHGAFGRLFPVSGLAWAAVAVCVLSLTAAVYLRQAQPAGQSAPDGGQVASIPQVNASPVTTGPNHTSDRTAQQNTGGPPAAADGFVPVSVQRVRNVKRAASQPRERELSTRDARGASAQGGTVDMAVRGAHIQLPTLNSGSNGTSRVQAQGIQLGTTAGTLRVALRDERGALVPMRSVSFGSQEPLSRQTAGWRVNTQDEEGVW
jgi:hypothetical protein